MIYIILPLQKEGQKISGILSSVSESLSGHEHKIIAVVDGADPETVATLNKSSNKNLIIGTHKIEMGMGCVLARGIQEAYLDSTHGDDILIALETGFVNERLLVKDLVSSVKDGSDVVIASRYRISKGYLRFSLFRHFFSLSVNGLLALTFPHKAILDYTIYIRAYRMEIINKAVQYFGKFGLIQSRGAVSNTEILIKLSFLTSKISEVPFAYDFGKRLAINKLRIWDTINEYFVLILYLKRINRKFEVFKRRSS